MKRLTGVDGLCTSGEVKIQVKEAFNNSRSGTFRLGNVTVVGQSGGEEDIGEFKAW